MLKLSILQLSKFSSCGQCIPVKPQNMLILNRYSEFNNVDKTTHSLLQ